MKTLNFPMDEDHFEALSAKRQAVSEAMGKKVSWRRFLLLMEKVPHKVLVKAAKKMGYDSGR